MRLLYAIYLAWLSVHDERELLDRCKQGTATTAWAISLRHRIDRLDRRIERLLSRSLLVRAARFVRALPQGQLTR